jgi:hypothetical protein
MTTHATTPGRARTTLVAGHAYTLPIVSKLPRPAAAATESEARLGRMRVENAGLRDDTAAASPGTSGVHDARALPA